MLLRFYSRRFVACTLGWSDGIIVPAVVLNTVSTALTSVAISYGLGRRTVHIPLENFSSVLYYSAIVRPISIVAYCLPKKTVVRFIISLTGSLRRGVWFLWTAIAILSGPPALAFIMYLAQCDPPSHLGHPLEPTNCCPDKVLDSMTYSVGCEFSPSSAWLRYTTDFCFTARSAFTDLVLAVFPIILFRTLQIKTSKKISVMIIMGLGFL
jgi:hypothetical protein